MADPTLSTDDVEAGYRSELASAKERVRTLEAELAARGGPRKKRPPRAFPWIMLGVGISMLAMGGLGAAAVIGIRGSDHPMPPPTAATSVVLTEAPSLHGAQWYTPLLASNRTPILMDVNGDGKNDLVGLAWNQRDDEHALHAVAFDGKNHQMLWHSEAISTQWMSAQTGIRRDGDTLVVTDSRNEIRIIDARTGKVKELTLAPNAKYTTPEVTPDDTHPELVKQTPTAKHKGFYAYEAHPVGDTIASFGRLESADYADWMVGWNKKSKAIAFEVPLRRESDAQAPRTRIERTVDADRVYTAFISADAKQGRVVARSLSTGEVAWTTDLPGTDEGAQLRSLRSEDGQVFLAVDGTLFVLDAALGREVSRLTGF